MRKFYNNNNYNNNNNDNDNDNDEEIVLHPLLFNLNFATTLKAFYIGQRIVKISRTGSERAKHGVNIPPIPMT